MGSRTYLLEEVVLVASPSGTTKPKVLPTGGDVFESSDKWLGVLFDSFDNDNKHINKNMNFGTGTCGLYYYTKKYYIICNFYIPTCFLFKIQI